MRNSGRLFLAAVTAALLLAVAVSTASARTLSVSNQNIRATWSRFEFATYQCAVTMEGSFHARTLAKVANLLVGAITRAIVNQGSCFTGRIAAFNGAEPYNGTTSPNTLPWHLTYRSFAGTLPSISSVRFAFSRYRFGVTVPGFFTGQYGNAIDVNSLDASLGAGGAVNSFSSPAGGDRITLVRCDTFICPAETRLIAPEGVLTVLNAATRVSITLI